MYRGGIFGPPDKLRLKIPVLYGDHQKIFDAYVLLYSLSSIY